MTTKLVDTRATYRTQAETRDLETNFPPALDLVREIDRNLRTGRRHYRTSTGNLLSELDEVIRAILNNDLAGVEA